MVRARVDDDSVVCITDTQFGVMFRGDTVVDPRAIVVTVRDDATHEQRLQVLAAIRDIVAARCAVYPRRSRDA